VTASDTPPNHRLTSPAARLLAKAAVTATILGVLAAKVNLHVVAAQIGSIGLISCAIGVLLMLCLSMLVALRWSLILARMQSPMSFSQSWRLVLIGLFFNQVLPSGLGGDAVRVWLMARAGTRLRTAFLSVAVDRLFALSAVILCMCAFLSRLLHGPAARPVALLAATGVIGILALLGLDHIAGWLARTVAWVHQATGKRLAPLFGVMRELATVVRLILRSPIGGGAVIGISVVNQLALGWLVYFIAQRLHVDIGLVEVIAVFSPAFLLSMMPISLGGWGVREVALVWLLGMEHVPEDAALAISLLFGIITTSAGLIGGVLWLWDRRQPAAVQSARTPDPARAPVMPSVLSRELTVLSPWVSVMARKIDFGGGKIETYHSVEQADYIAILAVTPDFKLPIVRQYRPALERLTWELPAGMVDAGEDPADTCIRELREETGLHARRVHLLGVHAADAGRMGNRIHSFLVETRLSDAIEPTEPGIQVKYVTLDQLKALILSGEFDLQSHVAALGLALLQPRYARLLGVNDNAASFYLPRSVA